MLGPLRWAVKREEDKEMKEIKVFWPFLDLFSFHFQLFSTRCEMNINNIHTPRPHTVV